MKNVKIMLGLFLMTFSFISCEKQENKAIEPVIEQPKEEPMKETKNIAVLETSMGTIEFEFLKDKAPKTCENFIALAEKGFYNNLIFHRIIANFMIQGGCPSKNGTGGPGYNIKAEFNDTKHVPGIVSMARAADPDSAGSQFFICVANTPHLDGQYTAFGKVIKGYDVVEAISKVATNPANNKPIKDVVIEKIEIK